MNGRKLYVYASTFDGYRELFLDKAVFVANVMSCRIVHQKKSHTCPGPVLFTHAARAAVTVAVKTERCDARKAFAVCPCDKILSSIELRGVSHTPYPRQELVPRVVNVLRKRPGTDRIYRDHCLPLTTCTGQGFRCCDGR